MLYEIDYLGSINMGSGKHANFLVRSSSELYKRGKPLESWGRKRCKETKRKFFYFSAFADTKLFDTPQNYIDTLRLAHVGVMQPSVHHTAVCAPTPGNPVHQTNACQLSIDSP
jgi:hypothetical protein